MSTGTPAIVPLVTRKYFRRSMSAPADRAQQLRRGRPLQRERRDLLRDVLDGHVEAGGVLPEPAQARIRRRPAERLLRQPRHRPVVDHLAVLVAPRRVEDLADRHLRHVAGDEPIDEPRGVAPVDQVLEERRDVDQRRGVADGVVLVLVMALVRADGVVAGPLAVVEALAERERALVDGGSDRHVVTVPSCSADLQVGGAAWARAGLKAQRYRLAGRRS